MLYVVLYCGALYLPHNTLDVRFRELLSKMFDFYALSQGVPHGGFGKRKNKDGRLYTALIEWHSPPFKMWLDAIMGFHERGTDWNLVAIGDWWDAFLIQHGAALPQDDRKNNILLAESTDVHPDGEAPQHVRNNPQQSTQTSPAGPLPPALNPSARKHHMDEPDSGDRDKDAILPPLKRRKRLVLLDDLEAVSTSLQIWRDTGVYSRTMSASSTPHGFQTREGSYESDGWTDGDISAHGYNRFRTPGLSEMLQELAARRPIEPEMEGTDAGGKGKGRMTRSED